MAERTRIPRASFTVSLIDDVDYIRAVQTPEGRDALALFTALVICAKAQQNDGVFELDSILISSLVRWPLPAFEAALQHLISMPGRWVVKDGKSLKIRSFRKWNSGWGGQRDGAGRPAAKNQVAHKRRIKTKSSETKVCAPDSDSDTVSDSSPSEKTHGDSPKAAKSPAVRTPEIEAIYSAYPRKVGKAAALKSIASACKTNDPGWLLQRVQAFAASPAGNAGVYTPHPATWFNQGRFNDDESEWQRERGDATLNGAPKNSAAQRREQLRADTYARSGPLPIIKPTGT